MPTIVPTNAAIDVDLWERLVGATDEMKTDKFWRDMAKPIDLGLRCLKDETEAFDSVSRAQARTDAIKAFEGSKEMLDEAAKNNMFIHESKLVIAALEQLRGGTGADEALKEAHASENTKYVPAPHSMMKGPAPAAPAAPATFDEDAARELPFKWEQDDDGTVSVRIPVPPECTKGNVSVKFETQHLTVSVAAHPLQPHVIDGDLLYAIKASECTWALEGKGSKRALALSLEKVQAEQEWAAVLADEAGKRKKGLTDLVSGMDGLGELIKGNDYGAE